VPSKYTAGTARLTPQSTERGCVQSTPDTDRDSTLKSPAASGVFQQAGFAKLLRLVFDTAALRGSAPDAPAENGVDTRLAFRRAKAHFPWRKTEKFRLKKPVGS
jgi:hypothetical protein